MSVSRSQENQLLSAENLFLAALAISLLAHLVLFGGYELGRRYGWWQRDLLPSWLKSTTRTVMEIQKERLHPKPVPQQEVPLLFVEVDPAVATPEPPKNAKYYSSKNSVAANPNPMIETQQPKIDGTQTHVAKTESVPRTKQFPLQPSAPKAPAPQKSQETAEAQPKPKGGLKPGDLAMAKPAEKPDDGKADTDKGDTPAIVPHKRWRTLAEAEMAQQRLVGEKIKQDGGVKRNRVLASFDAKSTAFGDYDAQIIAAIEQRWFDLLDNPVFTNLRTGKVAVEFHLNFDGRITDMRVIESSVDDMQSYVCQRAISEPSPYERWPSDMRHLIGANYRIVTFVFYYD
jgi:hypothetical protein